MASGEENKGFDLLQRFYNKKELAGKLDEVNEEEGEIELSLGLSLNGRFGVDPKRCNNIIRAASISGFSVGSGEEDAKRWSLGGAHDVVLSRTCSLPMDTEEWRKRKELQSLKRLEAKRKRMEKMKNVRMVRVKGSDEIVVGPPAQQPVFIGKRSSVQFCSQGSIGSQGSGAGSSGVSDPETHEIPEASLATNKYPEDGSPVSGRSSVEQRIDNKPAETVTENPSPRLEPAGSKDKETLRNMIGNMPCVSTRDGPDGKRINGFLYRCKNGEEVKIICVCHGDFFSPAEFVKHGGGGDVEHPLRHIVINPSQL
ncbi:Ninja-family protein [Heracleum sosnowskyi]|uniref:Ninja-family protein n=1 Tax=Heracleum sosnowskyi TaxID=360622 RepID=A0AAD8IFH0_9APIA|nr:Ninja-family protein [Heracleum sosnowskyi]